MFSNEAGMGSTPHAHALANVKDESLTDDNQLIESIGYPVKLVDCGADNLKITRPEDLPRAEAVLAQRRVKK